MKAIKDTHYDVIIVGSGFGSSFFLHKFLHKFPKAKRILVLERGQLNNHGWQLSEGKNSNVDVADVIAIPEGHKPWKFTIGLGGGTNCWWGMTPRMHPSDFELYSRYSVGRNWPISYADLEPYYVEAEKIMSISGDEGMEAMFPRSAPYPQPPHRLAAPDRIMKQAYPEHHFAVPVARRRIPTQQGRACCAHGSCNLCPVDAKFNIFNGMNDVYQSPRVSVLQEAEVVGFEAADLNITALTYKHGGQLYKAKGGLFVLGANGIFTPYLLQRSGIASGSTGKGINEQVSVEVEVFLDGLDNFDGSTATSGINYALFDGEHRRDAAATTVVFRNRWPNGLRHEYGRWRQVLALWITAEDLPQASNFVSMSDRDGIPLVFHETASDYAKNGIERALSKLPELLRPLPVESIGKTTWRKTESHIQGTTPMGNNPVNSEVDHQLIHHKYRNLIIVGSSVFPSCPTANPSLTVAALALRAGELIS
jgi:choline dehydrogenase-like flavoprotein